MSLRSTSQRRLTRSGATHWWLRWRLWSYLTIYTIGSMISSEIAAIMASIIQGSGLGPALYIITAADLHWCDRKWPAYSDRPRVQHTGVMQQSAIRVVDLVLSWHPRHFATWCLSCYCHCKVDLLRTVMVSATDRAKLESFVSRCKRLEYCSSEVPTYSDLTDEADDTLFSQIMANYGHVLQPLLPDRQSIPYSLRERSHNKTPLNQSTHLNNDDFLIRMLYRDSY